MNNQSCLAHFSYIKLNESTGMGRVAVHWRDALVRRGWIFRHYGNEEVPMPILKPLWPNRARQAWEKTGIRDDLFLAHEPSAEVLRQTGIPTVLFSHGLEARASKLIPNTNKQFHKRIKSSLTRPFWQRLARQRVIALRKCPLLFLINQDDMDFAISSYGRRQDEIFVFRNGVNASNVQAQHCTAGEHTILFYGSWLTRKGKSVLIEAAILLAQAGIKPRWLLVGTGKSESEVLLDWPVYFHSNVEVRPNVASIEDDSIYSQATLFVLPSFYEGQPLTLLQAMESGRCVITTRCCGQKDIIRNKYNGLLFDPGDSVELARLIAMGLTNKEMRFKLGCQAKADMVSRRWPLVADEVVDRLEQFVQKT